MIQRYKTIFQQASAETIEKKSRFIATVAPISTEEQAQHFIQTMKKQYWDASHNVFAYRIGLDKDIERMSDDGEPSGTAGMPVLDVLRGQGIINAVVNVTRYFGGTLLGTGGLVRAYTNGAKAGLEAAGVIEKILYTPVAVTVEYTLSGKVEHAILLKGHRIANTVYTDKVEFETMVESPGVKAFKDHMTDISGGQAVLEEKPTVYGFAHNGTFHLCS